ncbi:MAG: DUF2231 domain-containing protein [Idiomarina sp.]|nr:DUF2231 domain-containing protein [Idiomarina sp.]
MFEIIPNSHPIYVKFAVTLIVLVGVLQLALWFSASARRQVGLVQGMPWLVGVGALAVIATIVSGLIAYYTVAHDGPSHVVMTNHKYWGIALACVFVLGAGLFFSSAYRRKVSLQRATGALFVLALVLVVVTASKGSQLVYGHGIGVESLPEVTGDGHDHHH